MCSRAFNGSPLPTKRSCNSLTQFSRPSTMYPKLCLCPYSPTSFYALAKLVYLLFSECACISSCGFLGLNGCFLQSYPLRSYTAPPLESSDTIFMMPALFFLSRCDPPTGFCLNILKHLLPCSLYYSSPHMSYSSIKWLAPWEGWLKLHFLMLVSS